MDLHRLAMLVVLLTLIGFITVFQQVRTWRLGYRINELREKKRLLQEEQRRMQLEVARGLSSASLMERAQALGVNVGTPSGYNVVRVGSTAADLVGGAGEKMEGGQ